MRHVLIAVLLLATMAKSGAAEPGTHQARARRLNRQGMTKYDLGEYDAALALFKRAYETFPEPKILLFNIGQSYRKKREWGPALASYRGYLHNVPDASNRSSVEALIKELEGLVDAEKASDGKPPEGVAPAPETSQPAPSDLPAPVHQTLPRDESRSTGGRWYHGRLGWALAGGGVGAAVVGAVFLVHAQNQSADLPQAAEADRDGLSSDIRRNRVIGSVAVGIGAALVAAGAVRFVLTERSARRAQVAVGVGPRGFVLRGQF